MKGMVETMSDKMKVSSTPHVRAKDSTSRIMMTVALALLPAAGYGVWHFGLRALLVIVITVASCVCFEWIFCLITHKKNTIGDFSAVVTGLLLAMNLPVSVPWWIPILGAAFAIIVVKMLFGGLGQNFMNPALGARCFLLISFSKIMTDFSYKVPGGVDVISGATPLANLKNGEPVVAMDMILGNIQGTIGETSMIAVVLGGCILIATGVIDLYVTGSYILSFAAFILLFSGRGADMYYLSAHLAGGGLMLGAFFMATDYVTRPITKKGQLIYGILLGILTGIFRLFGPSAEGVSYAIIIGNLLVPLIEKISVPAYFGQRKSRKTAE